MTPAGWVRSSVADIAAPHARAIAIGPFGSNLKSDMYTACGIPVVRGQDIIDGRQLDERNLAYVPHEVADSMPGSIVRQGDLIFPHRGAIGRVGIVGQRPMLLSSSMMKLSCNESLVVPEFVFYYFRGPGRRELMTRASTVGTPGIGQPLKSLRGIPILFPAIAEQRAIAEVLGALDDKIAANQSLTDTAVSLVDAEYERCSRKSVLSELTFGNVADVGGGGTPRTSVEEYWDGSVPWATPTDVTALRGPYLTTTSRAISGPGLASCSSPLYPPGSILMTSRATIGAFAIAQQSMAVNQGFIVVNAHEADWQWWLFHDMRSRVDEFVSHANGATFLELSRGKFKQFRVRLVDGAALKEFKDFAGAVHGRAGAAMVESVQLAATRDTLLPQLMSGSIRIKDAERLVGEVI